MKHGKKGTHCGCIVRIGLFFFLILLFVFLRYSQAAEMYGYVGNTQGTCIIIHDKTLNESAYSFPNKDDGFWHYNFDNTHNYRITVDMLYSGYISDIAANPNLSGIDFGQIEVWYEPPQLEKQKRLLFQMPESMMSQVLYYLQILSGQR